MAEDEDDFVIKIYNIGLNYHLIVFRSSKVLTYLKKLAKVNKDNKLLIVI